MHIEVSDEFLKSTILLIVGDREECRQVLILHDAEDIADLLHEAEGMSGGNEHFSFIWMRQFVIDSPDDIAVFMHECTHLARRRMKICRLQGEEAAAYYMEYLVRKILTDYKNAITTNK